jgi:putative FmdB family regulatory protein
MKIIDIQTEHTYIHRQESNVSLKMMMSSIGLAVSIILEFKEICMPIYEYKCGKCGAVNEILVMDKKEELQCKSCNSKNLTKLMSAHNTMVSSVLPAASCGGSPDTCGAVGSCGMRGSCCGMG